MLTEKSNLSEPSVGEDEASFDPGSIMVVEVDGTVRLIGS